jgi:hypothetical protein
VPNESTGTQTAGNRLGIPEQGGVHLAIVSQVLSEGFFFPDRFDLLAGINRTWIDAMRELEEMVAIGAKTFP